MNMPAEQQLREVVKRLRMGDVSYFECEGPDFLLRVHFAHDPSAQGSRAQALPPSAPAASSTTVLRSTCMGMLLLSHPLGTLVALKEGDRVEPQQLVALLSVGELLTPVFAAQGGVVSRVIGTEGELTGYGDALFELRTA